MPRRRHRRCRRGIRDGEGQPDVPAFRSVLCGKFLVTLEVQISLFVANRKKIAELGPNAEDTRPESAEERGCSKIVRDLLIGISDRTDEKLFGQKVRSAPVERKVNAALILRGRVLEIVGEAADSRKRV